MPSQVNLRQEVEPDEISGFALQALSVLAGGMRRKHSNPPANLIDNLVSGCVDAVKTSDQGPMADVVARMRHAGICDKDIVGHYIPAVAHLLGKQWEFDQTEFAAVTMGVARLQGLLRQLDQDWCAQDFTAAALAPEALVLVPEGEQHTIGAMILTGQLRHNGVQVRLDLEATPKTAASLVAKHEFAAVMISSSRFQSLDSLASFVHMIKRGSVKVPIMIGGSVLDQTKDVCRVTGADHSTNDLKDALHICDLKRKAVELVLCGPGT